VALRLKALEPVLGVLDQEKLLGIETSEVLA